MVEQYPVVGASNGNTLRVREHASLAGVDRGRQLPSGESNIGDGDKRADSRPGSTRC